MHFKEDLSKTLTKIDGRGYKAYKELSNKWFDFGDYTIGIPYVQGDPFASPSKIFIRIGHKKSKFPDYLYESKVRQHAVEDFLTRIIDKSIKKYSRGNRGSGKSGKIYISKTGQEIIERTSITFDENHIEVRLYVGLPAKGRRILGHQANDIFFKELSKIVNDCLFYDSINKNKLQEHIHIIEDQEFLRQKLKDRGLISFIANHSILPRKSGIDDQPLSEKQAVLFKAPAEYEVEFVLPHKGKIKGMGIYEGITLIVGGGYHGKSTLLSAIELGVYNHIPGDGREYVVTRKDAVKIRAEDGRKIEKVNISPFINNLPQGTNTVEFTTENASGSTSQAANIIEALELGCKVLLIDEDTSATNFMIRDARMQKLVSIDKEPITPFIDKVRSLHKEHGVSTVVVVGGSGDYFDVADHVILMEEYLPKEVTPESKEIAKQIPSLRRTVTNNFFGTLTKRYPNPDSINPRKKHRIKVKSRGKDIIQFGYNNIDLSYIEQLINKEQTKSIGYIIVYMLKNKLINANTSLNTTLRKTYEYLDEEGLEIISPFSNPEGDFVKPRLYEVGAALNRLRTLKIKSIDSR